MGSTRSAGCCRSSRRRTASTGRAESIRGISLCVRDEISGCGLRSAGLWGDGNSLVYNMRKVRRQMER